MINGKNHLENGLGSILNYRLRLLNTIGFIKMKRTPKIVSKLLRTYFEICTSKFPVLDISEKLISTYDGDYPLFIVTYNVGEGDDYYV